MACGSSSERPAARRHKRNSAHLHTTHLIGRTTEASDVLVASQLVRGIAECSSTVLITGLIARCFFAALTQLTVQLPWIFGGRIIAMLEPRLAENEKRYDWLRKRRDLPGSASGREAVERSGSDNQDRGARYRPR